MQNLIVYQFNTLYEILKELDAATETVDNSQQSLLETAFQLSDQVNENIIKLKECLIEIEKFLKKDPTKDLELAAEDLRMATQHLGSIVGKVDVEEILGSIFKDFCIGK